MQLKKSQVRSNLPMLPSPIEQQFSASPGKYCAGAGSKAVAEECYRLTCQTCQLTIEAHTFFKKYTYIYNEPREPENVSAVKTNTAASIPALKLQFAVHTDLSSEE